jgi:hypothetical protein
MFDYQISIRMRAVCQNMTLISAQKYFKLQACELPLNTTSMEVASGKERLLDGKKNKQNLKTFGTMILRVENLLKNLFFSKILESFLPKLQLISLPCNHLAQEFE